MSLPVWPNAPFNNILFATDMSPTASCALLYATWLGRQFKGILNVVNVVPAEICENAQPPDPFYFRHSAEKQLAKLVDSPIFYGIIHREFVEEEEGNLTDVLLKLISKLQIDLVVLGTHGRGGLTKAVLGSISEEIAYISPCSVLAVGPNVRSRTPEEVKIRRILCALDTYEGRSQVLSYALWLGEHEHAHVVVLNTIDSALEVGLESHLIETTKEKHRLEELLAREPHADRIIEVIVETGSPAKQILQVAQTRGTDLIIMAPSSTVHPRLASHFPWTTTHQVLSHAQSPVLMVRA